MLENLNLIEAVQILAKNVGMKAVKSNGCQIKWITKHNQVHDSYKQLVFVSSSGCIQEDILTSVMLELYNYNCWSIVPDEDAQEVSAPAPKTDNASFKGWVVHV